MIRDLKLADHEKVMRLLTKEPEINLFIIGDIENYGYHTDFQKVWGDFDENAEQIKAVLVKYGHNFNFYAAEKNFDVAGFARILASNEYKYLFGKKALIEVFDNIFHDNKIREYDFAKLDQLVEIKVTEKVQRLEDKDLDKMLAFYAKMPKLAIRDTEIVKKEFLDQHARAFYIEKDGQIVSMARTTAGNRFSAMMVGIGTLPEYQKQGFSEQCVYKLGENILKMGKSLCLFYDSPEAAQLYKKLGFVVIGKWLQFENTKTF
ncbi:GNAT family N-acetyltransferase [bacterium]|jgi:uncharacterized protein|nr:GNAT family N-acetyltransferase [bacterium]MBT3581111.1 GNAT family N-acetyltransferase [bacterium]MBT4552572.1 GNAT family N-acetyltransferase [bacterium]MBT5988235.1 GNAT family N-acetyltransferase [bacterium]MBT7087920.1 GNAT family N-acetyltransferase [bacterium]